MSTPKKTGNAVIDSAPPTSGGMYQPVAPIGVGQNYTPPVVNDIFGQPASKPKPLYYPGAQNTIPRSLGAREIAQLQLQLKQLGFISPTAPLVLGSWGQTEASGFEQVLAWANSSGSDWKTALDDLTSKAQSLGSLNSTPTQTKQATNPLDIKALGDQTGLNYLGHSLTDQQNQSLTSDFQAKEAPYLTKDATTAEPNAQGWQEWAKTKVRNFDPVNFDAHKVLAGVDVLSKMLGSGQ